MTDAGQRDVDGLIPTSLADRIRSYHALGAEWLQELPALIAQCATNWGLTLLPAFEPGGDSSWTAPVKRSTGELAVLQITVPMPVHHDHITALQAWDGRGAVKLYAHDPTIRATLMECCVPGTDAVDLSAFAADDVAAEVLPQLWGADLPTSSGLQTLADACTQQAQVLQDAAEQYGDVSDAGPFREAAQLFTSLPVSSDRQALLHGDFTRKNVALSERGWLAIDPSSMAGDPAFDAAMFLQHDMNDATTVTRADALADRLVLDRQRIRSWLFALAIRAGLWHLSIGDGAMHTAFNRAAAALL